jgi:hypothetical protein
MIVARLLVIVSAALVLTRAVARAGLARGHRQVGDFVGWCVVAVVAVAAAVGALVIG